MSTSKLSKLVPVIDILGTDIEVIYKDEVLADDGTECLGLARMGEHTIEIMDTPTIKYDSKLCTLLHECLEHINSKLELDLEHNQISSLETALFHMLRSNPNFTKAFSIYLPRKGK